MANLKNQIFIITLFLLFCFLQFDRTSTASLNISDIFNETDDIKSIEKFNLCENWKLSFTEDDINNNNYNLYNNLNPNGYCVKHIYTLYCFGGGMDNITELYRKYKIRKIEELIICGWPYKTFDPLIILKNFTKLKLLRIEYSNMTFINNDFPELRHLQNINISWTNLGHTRPSLFKKVINLQNLDLRWNQLHYMDGGLMLPTSFHALYLHGNLWNCSRNLKWLLNKEYYHIVIDRDLLQCSDGQYSGRPVITVMEFKKKLKEECQHVELRNCSCHMPYVRPTDNGTYLIPIYSINCSNRQFMNFPKYLPMNTTILHLNNNNITHLTELNIEMYQKVLDIYLDNNQIDNIDILETSDWVKKFRIFSLKGNKLTKFPIYAIDNALEKNHNIGKLYLSNNPWLCDCYFTPKFQEFIMKYHNLIKDINNITCKYIDNDINYGIKIINLTINDVCQVNVDYLIRPLDLLNYILGLLIIFILTKLCFDYYFYKKYGKLPWLVTKLP